MAHNTGNSIVVTHGLWLHMPVVRVHHRHYPEIRGEARSLGEASKHLARQLARGLDHAHGSERAAIARAVADAVAVHPGTTRAARPAMAGTLRSLDQNALDFGIRGQRSANSMDRGH